MRIHEKTVGVWSVAAIGALTACSNEAFTGETASQGEFAAPGQPAIRERVSSVQAPLITSGYQVSAPNRSLWENGSTTFSVKLTRQPTQSVTLALGVSNAGEASLSQSTLTFLPANWSTPQVVTVTGIDDAQANGTTEFYVFFTSSSSADPSFNYSRANPIVPAPIKFFTFDREAGIVALRSGVPTERGDWATISYKLSRRPTNNVTLAVRSTNRAEAEVEFGAMPRPIVLAFDPENWDTWKTVRVRGIDDAVVDNDPTYQIRAAAISADPIFDGKTRHLDFRTYEDDQSMIVVSQAAGPFTCTSGASTLTITPRDYPGQARTLAKRTTDQEFVAVRILHVNLVNTYMHALTTEEVAQESEAFYHMRHRVIDATRGLLWPNINEITVPHFWARSSFVPGNFDSCTPEGFPCNPSDFGLSSMVVFDDYAKLEQEIEKQVSLEDYDFVMVSLPVDGVGSTSINEKIAFPTTLAFAHWTPNPPASRGWQEGKVMIRYVRPGLPTNWNIWMHELAHQVEWALERGGSTQMLNPDHTEPAPDPEDPPLPGFWVKTFGPRVSNHWSTLEEANLAAFFWTQRGQWSAMTTAADLPKGQVGRRAATKEISATCFNSGNYTEVFRDL